MLFIKNGKVLVPRPGWIAAGKPDDNSAKMTGYYRLEISEIFYILNKLVTALPEIERQEAFKYNLKEPVHEDARWCARLTADEYNGSYLVHLRMYSNSPQNNGGHGGWGPTPSGIALEPNELTLFLKHLDAAVAYAVCCMVSGNESCMRETAFMLSKRIADKMEKMATLKEAYDRIKHQLACAFERGEHNTLLLSMDPAAGMLGGAFARAYEEAVENMALINYVRRHYIFSQF